jgi:hypothetical protein
LGLGLDLDLDLLALLQLIRSPCSLSSPRRLSCGDLERPRCL